MNAFQIDSNWFTHNIKGLIDIEPVIDFDTKQQKADRDGMPKWRLQLLFKTPDMRKPEVVEVNFATDEITRVEPGMAVPVFKGLTGRHWSNQNAYGYSSGVSISADEIEFTKQANRAKPAEAA